MYDALYLNRYGDTRGNPIECHSMCTLFFGEQFLTLAVNGIHTINHVINIPIFGALYTRHIFKLNYHIIFGPC